MAGGKLTTYRLMAEQTVDRVGLPLSRTAHTRIHAPPNGVSGRLPPELCRDVVRHCCRNEWAVHLDHLLVRRTSWAYYRTDRSSMAETACSWMAAELGWNEERKTAELERYMRSAGLQKAELRA
jgi:glycerol-3-phosphate dehydrogenase